MSRPTERVIVDETIYYDITIYDADGTVLDADSTPTVQYRVSNSDTLVSSGITVSKPAGTTGLYKVAHDLSVDSALVAGVSLRYEETATIAGTQYKNHWSTFVRSASTGYTPEQIADQVWDESASQHNVGGSFGKFLRQVKEGLIVIEATVDDSSATTTSFITTLSSGVDDFYNDDTLVFISGSLTGQSRIIQDYNGNELRVTFDEPLTSAPADTDEFILLAGHNLTLTQIENQVWDATLGDHQTNGSTGKGLVDAAATGGDATLANQTAILAKLNTNPIEISNPLVDSSTLVLINHDNYSSNNSRLITFPVTTDYSSATNVKLIFETNGTNIKIASAVVASATSITVDLEVDFGSSLSFTDCSGSVCNQVATCDFALVASYSADEESIARGTAYIYNRAKEA